METQSLPPSAVAPPSQCKTGSEIIVDTLRALGVEVVFGYLGASVLPLFDRLYPQVPATLGFVRLPRQTADRLYHTGD